MKRVVLSFICINAFTLDICLKMLWWKSKYCYFPKSSDRKTKIVLTQIRLLSEVLAIFSVSGSKNHFFKTRSCILDSQKLVLNLMYVQG